MTQMRRGFTMIELIFVIVIIGILAAVALPKLTATRTDAKISTIVANTKNFVNDVKGYYTSQGKTNFEAATIKDITDVPVFTEEDCNDQSQASNKKMTDGPFYICDDDANVIDFTYTESNSTLTVAPGSSSSDIAEGVKNDPAIKALTAKSIQLGGVGVKR